MSNNQSSQPEFNVKREGILLSLVGTVGSGKTTISKLLIEREAGLKLSVSVTSRIPRDGEVDGESYFFVKAHEFEKRIASGEFFEFEKVHDNYYGTLKSTVESAISSGCDLLLDIDIRGSLSFKKAYPYNSVIVFLVPPSFLELKRRVKARSPTSDKEFARRIQTAQDEYAMLKQSFRSELSVDYFVVNSDLENCYATVRAILYAERSRYARIVPNSRDEIIKLN